MVIIWNHTKIYKSKELIIIKLENGNKTAVGAKKYIQQSYKSIGDGVEIVFGVGSNDLDSGSVQQAISNMETLVETCKKLFGTK